MRENEAWLERDENSLESASFNFVFRSSPGRRGMAMSTPKVYSPLPTPSGSTSAPLGALSARTPSPAVARKAPSPLRARERIASDMDASQLERAPRETLIEVVLRNTEIKEELNLKLGRLEDERESSAREIRELRRAEEAGRILNQQVLADQSRMYVRTPESLRPSNCTETWPTSRAVTEQSTCTQGRRIVGQNRSTREIAFYDQRLGSRQKRSREAISRTGQCSLNVHSHCNY